MVQIEKNDVDQLVALRVRHGYVRLAGVLDLVPCSDRTWLRFVANGTAPAPVRLGSKMVAWRIKDVCDWLDAQTATGAESDEVVA